MAECLRRELSPDTEEDDKSSYPAVEHREVPRAAHFSTAAGGGGGAIRPGRFLRASGRL